MIQSNRKKTIRVPLTAEETQLLDEVCVEYKLQRATLLQIYFNAAWKGFMKDNKIFFKWRQSVDSYEEAVVIRIDPATYQEVKIAAQRMIMTVPGFSRYLIIPMLQERQVVV